MIVLANYQTGFGYKFRHTNGWYELQNPILPSRDYERTQTQSTQPWMTTAHARSQTITVKHYNMVQTSTGMVVCDSKKLNDSIYFDSFFWCVLRINDTSYSKSVWGTDWNLPARHMMVQLLALYNDPDSHNAKRCRQTNGRHDVVYDRLKISEF